MKFYNRTKEIEELKRIQGRAFESRSRMTVITGRRRIRWGRISLSDFCLVTKERSLCYVTEEQGKKHQRDAMIK